MALKALLLKRQIDEKQARMTELTAQGEKLKTREAALEMALGEAQNEEDLRAVQDLVEAFTAEQVSHRDAMSALQGELDALETELRTLEEEKPAPPPKNTPSEAAERKDDTIMMRRMTRVFGGMTMEQRSALVQREDVQSFLTRFRDLFGLDRRRSVTGADLGIPTVILEVLRQNIEDYSKLTRYVRYVSIRGDGRQTIMGTIPEAVWTEMCGALNELNFTMSNVEVDGYKAGGYVAICNALLEDSDLNLLSELINGIGGAIGKARDKAILFGTGVKMPLGIATRLAQTAKPSSYPDSYREWEDLHQSNVITIPAGSTTGLTLFQQFATAAAAAKGRYSRGAKFWVMNEATYTKLQVEAMSFNASGAIVSAAGGTMPVVGGDILVFSDDIMPDDTILGGYGDLYLLAERAGMAIASSDIPLFLQDQTVVKGVARYDGTPVIPEAFVAIGVGKAPTMTMPFPPDVANPSVAALRALSIGSLTLSPVFDPDTTEYTASTSNTGNMVSAVPTTGSLATVKLNGKKLANGTAATWEIGENSLSITVTNGDKSKTYAVTVTKT